MTPLLNKKKKKLEYLRVNDAWYSQVYILFQGKRRKNPWFFFIYFLCPASNNTLEEP